jgi:DNA-binding NtrC family response regulator
MKEFAASDATILLLDSDKTSRTVLHEVLESANYLVIAAGNLATAVDRLEEMSVDLLIIRPYVNSMPGHYAAHYLRSRHPGLQVLVAAGFPDDDRIRDLYAVENFYTFPARFPREELLAKVKDVLKAVRKEG